MKIPENFDRWMFDYLEGNLSPAEVVEFEQFLAINPEFDADAEAWQNTTIEAEAVDYPNIHLLERKRKFAGWYSWGAAAALVILLLAGGYSLFNPSANKNETAISKNELQSDLTENSSTPNLNGTSNVNSFNNAVVGRTNSANFSQLNLGFSSRLNALNNRNFSANGQRFSSSNSNSNEGSSFSPNDYLNGWQGLSFGNSKSENESNDKAIEQEKLKFESGEYGAQYANNPSEQATDFNLNKLNKISSNSFSAVVKRVYRKIEKVMGYPIGIINPRDPDFLTPENDLLASNPAFAGGMLRPRFEMSYRNQWMGTDVNVQKTQFSFDNYVQALRGGFGFSLNSAVYNGGALSDNSIDFMYSPKIALSKNVVFEPAIKVTLGFLTGNSSKLMETPNVEMDRGLLVTNSIESVSAITNRLWYKDYGVGFVLNADKFYFGLSADNLANHYATLYRSEGMIEPVRSPVLFNGIAGFSYVSNSKKSALSPFISARKYGDFMEGWAGLTIRINHFTIGGSYSTSNNYVAAIGIKFDQFKLTYQYDFTRSLYTETQLGSHNIGLRFTAKDKKTRIK